MDVAEIIASRFSIQTDNGACGRTSRLANMICDLIKEVPGNIVEIGCGVGQSSVHFLFAAEKYGRKFIAVDPWYDTCRYKLFDFCSSVNIMSQSLELCRCASNEQQAIDFIQSRAPIAFGFVDGDMYNKDAVLKDIQTLADCCTKVICVDDQKGGAVTYALGKFLPGSNYQRYSEPAMHETYLVRNA